MKKSSLILMAAVVLAAMSCGGSGADGVLDRAEAIMNERPERALEMLDSLAVSGVRGKSVEARLSLLRSMALDKNAMDTADVSIVLPAVRYYGRRGDELRKAQAYFYYGRILQNGGDDEAALEAISKAELYAERTDDLYLRGLIADSMGQYFEQEYEFKTAISLYLKALDYFKDVDNSLNMRYMHESLSRVYIILDNTSEALDHAREAMDIAELDGNPEDIIETSLKLAYVYYSEEQYEPAIELFDRVVDTYCNGILPQSYYMLLSQIYYSLGNMQDARLYAESLLDDEDVAPGAYALLSRIEEADGNYKKSNEYLNELIKENFDDVLSIKEASIHEADMRYKNRELVRIIEERDIRIRYITLIWSLSILTVIAIALSVVQTRRRQLQKKDAELNEYRNRVTTMQEYSRILEKIKDSVPEKDELIESQINILNRLMNILVHSQEEIKLTFYNEFLNLTHKSEEGSSAMKAVFLHSFEVQYPEVRRTLKYNYPALTDKDIDLYSLIGLGCSTSVIAYLYTTSESYIYNCRMSLRKKLNLSDDRNAFAVHLSELTSKQ